MRIFIYGKLVTVILLIFIISNKLYSVDKVLRFKHLTSDEGLPNNAIDCIIQDKYGFIWIASLEGLSRFDGYKIRVFQGNPKISDKPLNNRPVAMANDSHGNLWIAFASEYKLVCRYNFETDNFTRLPLSDLDEKTQSILRRNLNFIPQTVQNKDYIWDSKSIFLTQTKKSDQTKYVYKSDVKSNWAILDEFILSLYIDNQNTLWVGTDNGGVSYADINQPDFVFYSFQDKTQNDMKESTIRAIYQDLNGILWVGTRNNGFAKLDSMGTKLQIFRNNPKEYNSLINNSVRKIYGDKYGFLWIGTKGGLDKFDPRTNTFKHYIFDNRKTNPRNWIFAVYEDKDGLLWVGTWLGLVLYDREHDKFIKYFSIKDKKLEKIRDIIEDKHGDLWVGTEGNGLSRIKKLYVDGNLKLVTTQYIHQPDNSNSLQDDWIYCLCEDSFGNIWIGTGSGLNKFNPEENKFTSFKNNFISDRIIHGILYEKGSVWVSHQKGLTEINCNSSATRNYTKSDDLYDNEFSEDASFKNLSTGKMYFGGNRGYISFQPEHINSNLTPPKVVLTDLKISNNVISVNQTFSDRIILKRPLYLTKDIELKWFENNVQIEFAAFYYSNPQNVKFSYRLNGFEKSWTSTTADIRTAVYSNLAPGTYLFEVFATNPDGISSIESANLKIVILPPWWRTWWAYTFYVLCVLSVICFSFKYIFDRQKFQHELQIERVNAEKIKMLDGLKTKFFTNISHEFRTPLSLIIDPVDKLLQNNSEDNKNTIYYNLIKQNAYRLLDLINQFLDFKKAESGNMVLEKSTHDFVLYVRNITECFDYYASNHNVLLNFESNVDTQNASFDIAKMDNVILNLLSNAFKNTKANGVINLQLILTSDKSQFVLKVSDTGVGIPADMLEKIFNPFYQVDNSNTNSSSGIGLALVKELVELHNGTIEVSSRVGEGSIFILYLPIVTNEVVVEEDKLMRNYYFDSLLPEISIQTVEPDTDTSNLPTLLIVEDNVDVRNYLEHELKDLFRIITAEDGDVGLEKAFEVVPDILLSDIMMPGISGIELCKLIKSDERTSHIPVVLLTAQQADEFKMTGYETGADSYITKPFNTNMLRIRLVNLIESRSRLRKLYDKSTGFDTQIIAVNNVDKVFLDKLVVFINENLSSPTFDIEKLAGMMNLSRTQLYRKIKALTDKSALEFVTTIRLNKAAELLLMGMYNITQVSELVGFSEVGNFTRSFIRQFGLSPKAYKNSFPKS